MFGEDFFALPLTRVVRFLDQEGSCLSFTGKLFYRAVLPEPLYEGSGAAALRLVPCERYGCYTPSRELLEKYQRDYGDTGRDPICGPPVYRVYNAILDTNLILVRGLVRWSPVKGQVFGLAGMEGVLQDAQDLTPYVAHAH